MPTLGDVIAWANTMPAWQGDLVRRLLETGSQPLSAADFSDVSALARADLKLAPPPVKVTPVPPAAGKFSGSSATATAIKLLSIDDVQNVNIIKPGQTLPFAESGVTGRQANREPNNRSACDSKRYCGRDVLNGASHVRVAL